jgi:hypothetical protein
MRGVTRARTILDSAATLLVLFVLLGADVVCIARRTWDGSIYSSAGYSIAEHVVGETKGPNVPRPATMTAVVQQDGRIVLWDRRSADGLGYFMLVTNESWSGWYAPVVRERRAIVLFFPLNPNGSLAPPEIDRLLGEFLDTQNAKGNLPDWTIGQRSALMAGGYQREMHWWPGSIHNVLSFGVLVAFVASLRLNIVAVWRQWSAWSRKRRGCCGACGYDMVSLGTATCPECGTAATGIVYSPTPPANAREAS